MEELELKPISSMFEEPEEAVTEVTNSIFSDFDAPEEGEEKVENKEVEKDIETEVEEVKENNEDEETDLTSVKTLYNYWKEFLPFDDTGEPTLEFLREQQERLPEKFFLSYVDTSGRLS